ncbi:hypothetical protein [Coraliomargarita akajimensis]|uniref:Uncharacterized protein n=1 Tax=Coraliomargarita akajimensis (strain DSM 45221 / IAM 15411 / JCM 23193 / KCTC 12865 / 04OKA010-24) TaxID=583355 RepID=D5EK87_CORAD|nr:hypothetical protein [Coraliomargarita akajimensis]ADE54836.1 hypothetical protein Caka_1817 [Coraliomargarita akajimensis DSM 45221]
MRRIKRLALLIAIAALLALAIYPYGESIRKNWQDLRSTWELVRSASSDHPSSDNTDLNARQRSILTPATAPTTKEALASEDPVLAEARERAHQDPEAAMVWLQSASQGQDRIRGMLEVIAIWAAEDSEGALLWLESNAQGIARHETIHSGMKLWSQQDPEAAAAWISGMVNDGSKSTAAVTLIDTWTRTHPDAAAAWLQQLPQGSIRQDASEAYILALSDSDPAAASMWALRESTNTGNPDLFNASIQAYTQLDPKAAANYIRSLENTSSSHQAAEQFIQTFAEQDPSGAALWLSQLPAADPLYDSHLHSVLLQEWSRSDSVAASAWLSESPEGPNRDAAIVGFAQTMIDFEPEAVALWTNSISDAQTRVNWLTYALQTWGREAPNQALEWLKTTELEPSLRQRLANEIGFD